VACTALLVARNTMPVKLDIDNLPKYKKVWAKSRYIQDITQPFLCEWCWKSYCADVHHIEEKGMGGRKGADTKENLIAVCRHCHDLAHQSLISKTDLKARVELILNVVEEMHNGTTGEDR
jgi:5-methylcytosine-specific restriction endonuclease McrA